MNDDAVYLTAQFNVSHKALWEAWTQPVRVKKWFGSDPEGDVLSADLDVKKGGKFTIVFQDADGTVHTCMGKYAKVNKFVALSFSWEWKAEPGFVSAVNIQFQPNDSGTLMTFEHKNLNPHSLHGYEAGWKSTFEKLNRMFLEES
jgi:uncharacterized protein YndB with AHSA1/START domain